MAIRSLHASAITNSFDELTIAQKKLVIRISTLIPILGFWEFIGHQLGDFILAPFSTIVRLYVEMALNTDMYFLLYVSLREAMFAFVLAIIVGIPLGLVMGRNIVVESLSRPWAEMFFVASTSSLLPLFIVLFGIDFMYRFAILYYAALTVILLNVYHGAKAIDPAYLDVAQAFGASQVTVVKDIILPASLPHVLVALRLGALTAVRVMLLAGMFIAHGYGGLLLNTGHQTLSTAPVIVLIFNMCVLFIALRKILKYVEVRLAPWYQMEGTH